MKKRKDQIFFAKAVYDGKEINAVVDCLKYGWLGTGRLTERFEKRFAKYIGMPYASLVNSGSSANLLAIRVLNLPEGSKVLTCAAGFPSTLSPIWHSHLQVVAVDVDLKSLNIDLDRVEQAVKKHKDIKAIIFAHTLGNPVDMKRIMHLASKYKLQVIEDNCDGLGSEIYGRKTGSFGNFSTCSFYASHHMTLAGAGGIVLSKNEKSAYRVKSLREWGKEQITLGYDKDHGVYFDSISNGVPYDHRYSYSEIGYNFKVPEIMAAFGLVQMDRLENFHRDRRKNFKYLMTKLNKLGDYFHFVETLPQANPSWFNFPLTLRDKVPFSRKDLVEFLEKNKIRTRLFFAGNILRQSGFKSLPVILVGGLETADKVHRDSFLLGVHSSQTKEMLDYMIDAIEEFIKTNK
ncbi:MAG: aminotransferase class I/II-fold pyridoxal phosphate-dependent enzyme [Candidatus Levybacteria bacterium]|nr:aminotransferase class I/II-fold pyridoxal phosphate-dependent enzyme [Candidatus Levybacteria bacterium]